MIKIIINADDLGVNKTVNDEIFELIALGRVSSATIIANGPAFDDAVQRALLFPNVSFGVHLNVTEFRPLTRSTGLDVILDSEGNFFANKIRKVFINAKLREAIYKEWYAQIQKIRQSGLPISHIDSHHHVHTIPSLFSVLKKIQLSCNVYRVRATLNIYRTAEMNSGIFHLAKKYIWNIATYNIFRTQMTDGFTSLNEFIDAGNELSAKFKTIELMVHPGSEAYTEETELLYKNWEDNLPFKIKLISYFDV